MLVKVSIIIPVYNSDKFLDKCLKSCLNQTLKEIEIIAINDASTDNSSQIMKRYEDECDGIIKCVYLESNVRQGAARNIGIKQATGEYIMFVDSDDWIEPDMCKKMYECASRCDDDIVFADMYVHRRDGTRISNVFKKELTGDMSEEKLRGRILSLKTGPVCALVRHVLFKDNRTMFPEFLYTSEDGPAVKTWTIKAKRISKICEPLYHYRNDYISETQKRVENGKWKGDFVWIRIAKDRMLAALGKDAEKYKEEVQMVLAKYLLTEMSIYYNRFKQEDIGIIENIFDEINGEIKGLADNNKYYLRCFTPNQRRILKSGASCYCPFDEIDYKAFYEENKSIIKKILQRHSIDDSNAVVWSNTAYARGFVEVFPNIQIVNEKSGKLENIDCILSLSTWHNSNINNCYPEKKIIDIQFDMMMTGYEDGRVVCKT